MRYIAELQRFDSAHVTVCEGDNFFAVQEAATTIYAALVPAILREGDAYIAEMTRIASSKTDPDEHQNAIGYRRDGISGLMRPKEWGIGVYDTQPEDPEQEYAVLVFWVGATREDPKSERKVVRP